MDYSQVRNLPAARKGRSLVKRKLWRILVKPLNSIYNPIQLNCQQVRSHFT
ncbi:MAG: hypothetical protein KME08_03560 [Aphanothece sp. CMT-3BRIN-NPC111]|nr:hypothetical protein [Aphanothece sp. CMT-3BRIN-NPC111]